MSKNVVQSVIILAVVIGIGAYLISKQPKNSEYSLESENVANTSASILSSYGTQVTLNNCTYTKSYWQSHPESWPVSLLPEVASLGRDGVSVISVYNWRVWMNTLNATNLEDARILLAQELFTAKLNITSGAEAKEIFETITEVESLLEANSSVVVDIDSTTGERMLALMDLLALYNRGIIGPGNCGA